MSRDRPDFIDSVEKAVRVLMAFSESSPSLRVSEAARITGLSRPTARRLLLTFEALDLVRFDGSGFRLGPRALRLGYGYLASLPIRDVVQEQLVTLAEEFNESCSAATLDGDEIVYIARASAKRSHGLTISVGSRLPAYATSLGRVLLADLPEAELESLLGATKMKELTLRTVRDVESLRGILRQVREQGFALVDQEREVGVLAAAAPIREGDGPVIAAMNVSVNAARVSVEELSSCVVPRLMEVAGELSASIALLPRGAGVV